MGFFGFEYAGKRKQPPGTLPCRDGSGRALDRFAVINGYLQERGLSPREGTIVDATVIHTAV